MITRPRRRGGLPGLPHAEARRSGGCLFSGATALLAIAVGFYLMRGVLAADQGTPKMIEIAKAIQEGAQAYLRRQFKTIAIIMVPLAVLVFVTCDPGAQDPDGSRRS